MFCPARRRSLSGISLPDIIRNVKTASLELQGRFSQQFYDRPATHLADRLDRIGKLLNFFVNLVTGMTLIFVDWHLRDPQHTVDGEDVPRFLFSLLS